MQKFSLIPQYSDKFRASLFMLYIEYGCNSNKQKYGIASESEREKTYVKVKLPA